MTNPYLIALKEYVSTFMGEEKAAAHLETLERASRQLVTDNDFRNFVGFMVDIYESGYRRSYEDCRAEFERHGINVQVSS